ncbi:MAG: sigma-E factor negative regulatory protein RseA [Oceanicoccus sp.]|jgi:sigma-E factor negative regulatory protein RseA
MSEKNRESLSALMDGEAEQLELRRLLSSEDEALIETWSRYHLARDIMQDHQHTEFRHLDISARVSASIVDIEKQEAMAASDGLSAETAATPWWRPMASFAVAASVTIAVVVGVQSVEQPLPGLNPDQLQSQLQNTPQVASRVYPVAGSSMQASGNGGVINYRNTTLPGNLAASRAEADEEAQQRLEQFMLRHTERAALNNGQGMISFARIASFEEE